MLKIAKPVPAEAEGEKRWWITGETYPYREELKAAGALWAAKRAAWYYTGPALPPAIASLGVVAPNSPIRVAAASPAPAQEAQRPIQPSISPAAKLRKLGDGMKGLIEKLSVEACAGQNSTPKRERQRASRRTDRMAAEKLQSKLYALADAHDNGTIPATLVGVVSKAMIHDLVHDYPFPRPVMHRAALTNLHGQINGRVGSTVHGKLLTALSIRMERDLAPLFGVEEAEALKALQKFVAKTAPAYLNIGPDVSIYLEAMKIGLDTEDKWKQAVATLETLGDPSVGKPTAADQIHALTVKAIQSGIPGFFPTPEALARWMIDVAGIPNGAEVLEPSAGSGNIAVVLRDVYGCTVTCLEWDYGLQQILELKGFKVAGSDFFAYKTPALYIAQNPPFEDYEDVRHVHHAYNILEEGGTLVSVMATGPFTNSEKRAREFQAWFKKVGGKKFNPPLDRPFEKSERPTSVSVCIVVIEK